ncbi:cytoskeletal protein CcmA (bactofilin family) [Natronospira proteinivora]|uniref:Cytoskeletal protein CcmA (Bactofilin family) n=1 Tax=Natronospira proteinivora TaxID=1807133 RepID=A0ABT1GEV4_9GAMM|nr:polymer-forming cytoskeletal protein [Natronospira proteinivora]MCP1728482.1 cytoskeletal protein CcmA (bactofilin family) [Natronospira proteinivora]
MWGSGSKKKSTKNAKIETLVGRNTEITGDVHFEGGMHVEGTVRGNVHAEDESCVISVSQHGVIEGDVKVPHISLDGTVTGDVYARERVELAPHAKVNGDVYYNLIQMAAGASVNGKMVHKPAEQPLLLEKGQTGTRPGSGGGSGDRSERNDRGDRAGQPGRFEAGKPGS